MTFLVSLHMQDPVPDWTQAILQLPPATVLKFFQTENCSEAKQYNPNVRTSKRYYNANQGQYWHNIDPYVGARNWLKAFVDGTFFQHAQNIDFIEGLNEEMSVESKPPEELQELIKWNQALCDIWYNEYQKDIPEYAHIDLVLCNTAIGNDIPIEIAYLAHEYGYKPVVGYHPYVPTQNKQPLAGEEQYYSQRWQVMDQSWQSQGLSVRWMFTEIGPVGYHEDANGNISLHPNDGWKHSQVCNGDLDAYISILEYWAQATADSVAYYENRVMSGQIFTTTISSQGWDSFKTNQPELGTILNHFAQWQPDTPPPPNGIDRNRLYIAGKTAQKLYLDPDWALFKAIDNNPRPDGMYMTSNEFDYLQDGQAYKAQTAMSKANTKFYIYYVPVGDWGNVKVEVYAS